MTTLINITAAWAVDQEFGYRENPPETNLRETAGAAGVGRTATAGGRGAAQGRPWDGRGMAPRI